MKRWQLLACTVSMTLREVISRLSYNVALCNSHVIDSTTLITSAFSIYPDVLFIRRDAMRCDDENNFSPLACYRSTGGLIAAPLRDSPTTESASSLPGGPGSSLPLYPNGIIICISRDMVSNFKRWCSRAVLYQEACTGCLRGSLSYDCRQAMVPHRWADGPFQTRFPYTYDRFSIRSNLIPHIFFPLNFVSRPLSHGMRRRTP